MIETIAVARVLREAVASPYRNLVTRPTGAAVRARIEAALAAVGASGALLDFSEVELLDLSCADEIVAKLVRRTPRSVALRGLHEHLWDAVDEVLRRQGLAVVLMTPDDAPPVLLGAVSADQRLVFDHLSRAGETRAPETSRALGWTCERAAQALDKLQTLGIACRAGSGAFRLPLPLTPQ